MTQANEVKTYLPVPAGAPVVKIHDLRTDEVWYGRAHNGIVCDHAGFLDPEDVGFRFHIFDVDGVDVTEMYA